MNNFSYKTFLRPLSKENEGEVAIYIRVIIDRKKKDYSLKIHTQLKYWNESKAELKSGHMNLDADNVKIKFYLGELNALQVNFMVAGKIITFEDVDKVFKGDSYQKESFYDFVKNQKEILKGKIKPGTVASWDSEIKKLKEFAPTLTWGKITVPFLKEYETFLRTTKQNTFITIHKSHRFIKARINDAINDEVIKENPYARFKIGKAPEGNMQRLTRTEVNTLAAHYLKPSTPQTHKHVLRYFLFSCYTGLRYSDLKALTYGKIIEGKYLQIRMQKTGEPLRLDLPNRAKELLEKGKPNESVFKVITCQKTNTILKTIMTNAGITKSISIHCARHTFATLAGEIGIPVEVIKELMGHSNINITLGYVKVTQPALTRGMMMIDKM